MSHPFWIAFAESLFAAEDARDAVITSAVVGDAQAVRTADEYQDRAEQRKDEERRRRPAGRCASCEGHDRLPVIENSCGHAADHERATRKSQCRQQLAASRPQTRVVQASTSDWISTKHSLPAPVRGFFLRTRARCS